MSWYRELERVPNSSATRCAGPGRRRARAPRAAASALKSEVESAARRAPRDHSRCVGIRGVFLARIFPARPRGTSAAIVSIHSVFLFVISAFFCFDRTQRYPRRLGGASARSRFVFGTIRLFQLPPPTSRASRPPTQSSGETSADPPRARPRARQVPPSGRGRPAARFPGSASRAESYFPVQRGQ